MICFFWTFLIFFSLLLVRKSFYLWQVFLAYLTFGYVVIKIFNFSDYSASKNLGISDRFSLAVFHAFFWPIYLAHFYYLRLKNRATK
jgi:hypothetical protein